MSLVQKESFGVSLKIKFQPLDGLYSHKFQISTELMNLVVLPKNKQFGALPLISQTLAALDGKLNAVMCLSFSNFGLVINKLQRWKTNFWAVLLLCCTESRLPSGVVVITAVVCSRHQGLDLCLRRPGVQSPLLRGLWDCSLFFFPQFQGSGKWPL